MSEAQNVERAALDWLTRVNDPAFAAWDEWEAWLAQDPRHAQAYWRLAEDEADIVAALSASAPAPTALPTRRSPAAPRRLWFAAAAAAAVVVVAGSWMVWSSRPQTWSVETSPGEQRTLTLTDGTRLHLDASTRLTLDHDRPRYARLEEGRVLAEVVHDETRPFSIVVGDAVLTDLGTAFDVTRLDDGLRVAVSEGLVRVDLEDQAVTLKPGDGLVAHGGVMTRRAVSALEVDTWRTGRLVYQDERLSVVAQDLARALGRPVTVTPAVASRRFTGSLGLTGKPDALRPRLEILLGVSIEDNDAGWRLTRRPAP